MEAAREELRIRVLVDHETYEGVSQEVGTALQMNGGRASTDR